MNRQIYEEASNWFVNHRVGDMDAKARREFNAWMRASPQHVEAYLELAGVWNEGPGLGADSVMDRDDLFERAMADTNDVVPLHVTAPPYWGNTTPERADQSHNYARYLLVAVAFLVVTCVIGWMFSQRGVFVTNVGEQRSIQLADGSTVDLNTRSRIRVHYADNERLVELLEGQALFRVVKDINRPFVVLGGMTSVRAVGTQFEVYRRNFGTTVTVLEGRVAVLPSIATLDTATSAFNSSISNPATVYVAAGERVEIEKGVANQAVSANLDIATAWTRRQLVFENASLEEVAEEFNRYNERRLVVMDSGSRDFHITGVFSSADPGPLIRFLRERRGIQVQETAREIHIIRN